MVGILTEEHEQARDSARRFAEEVIRPVAAELDRTERFPEEIYRQMAELGLFGITVPAELGGAGMDALAYALVMEELSRGYASVADQCGLVELLGTLLTQHGTDAQRDRYLRPLLRAERRCAYAITEAEAGSDVSGIRTTATRTDKGWRLDGGKLWIHNAPVCDFAAVLARTDKAAGHRGMSIFLVDRDLPGFSVGEREHKMGQRASQVGALHFDGIELPGEARLGPEGRGFHMMMSVLDKGRIGIAALAVGIARAGLEAALPYALERRQFDRPIADNQGLQWMLADMAKDIQAARLLTWDAAMKLDRGEPATMACSMAKLAAGDTAVAQTANAVQIFGGSGYIRGFEVERLYRDAKICQIYEGTQQIQRTIIARELIRPAR
ncbi:MAG TPA: acyl-CoA dehydrogenase family protein [Geminicoccaceae bacterium]|nr:acyl-CoA dehydrogenase family protein [Geminicoccus sp.]HMU49228.1 acyl-CoA dehydrogenase family protein [Geminicoccaceae bacterium]